MIAGEQYFHVLEEYCKTARIMYDDEMENWGVWSTDEVKANIRKACKGLSEIYKSSSKSTEKVKTWQCFVPFEHDDYHTGYSRGVKIRVRLWEKDGYKKEYFTVEIWSGRETDEKIWKSS